MNVPDDTTESVTMPGKTTRHALQILAASAILALLYLGREILVPITLAGILSLLMAPLVRTFKRWHIGQVGAVLSAVALVTTVLAGAAFAIIVQLVAVAHGLPQYEQTIRDKVQAMQAATAGRLTALQGEAGKIFSQRLDELTDGAASRDAPASPNLRSWAPIPVEIHEPRPDAGTLIRRLAASVWGPLGTAGIVIITLIFALLEYESLRDRFIRLTGAADLRATTDALNDAGERLSRYFVSQLAVNGAVGVCVGLGLLLIGIPHVLLWAALTALLRFVPYVGIVMAAGSTALFAAAVDPGWATCFATLGLYLAIELIISQAIEPLLYGHTTGMSPLSVVLSAVFWSWMWGPMGLLLSTPLMLCLVVAGRNVKGLEVLGILFSDAPALTLSQRFYQRALAGDPHELIADARTYLARKSLAKYCDSVLRPALQMATSDFTAGKISPTQQQTLRDVVGSLLSMIGAEAHRPARRRGSKTVLDQPDLAVELRRQREARLGQWQGPLEVPLGSVALCASLGSRREDLDTEILVRVLRDVAIDARHASIADLENPPEDAKPESVAMVFLTCLDPAQDWERFVSVASFVKDLLPGAPLIGLLSNQELADQQREVLGQSVDAIAYSFEAALGRAQLHFPVARSKSA